MTTKRRKSKLSPKGLALEPRRKTVAILIGGSIAVLFAVGGIALLDYFRQPKVTEEEVNQLVEQFPDTVTRLVHEKRKDAHLRKVQVTSQDLGRDGTLRIGYLLSFDEKMEGGETATNTLNQLAVLRKDNDGWRIVDVNPGPQELLFQAGTVIETKREPASAKR